VISVISNVAPAWMADMYDAALAGDWARARAIHHQLQPLCELLFAEPSPAPIKACMALAAAQTGVAMTDEIRAPLYQVEPALRERLRTTLAAAGLLS
jgi:4-hydroxy-tetrahydrodipicolinate synthase